MPEFILDRGSPEAAKTFADLDSFTRGYVEAAFFCGVDDPADKTGNTDADVSFADLAPEALADMIADCAAFQATPAWRAAGKAQLDGESAELDEIDDPQAGWDFWFARNGHGAGFWDGDWPEPYATQLTEAARAFNECDLYLGDDGRVYAQ